MLVVRQIIEVYKGGGVEESVQFVSQQLEFQTPGVHLTSPKQLKNAVAALTAKYRSLLKHQENPSAAQELEAFLESNFVPPTPTVLEQSQKGIELVRFVETAMRLRKYYDLYESCFFYFCSHLARLKELHVHS